MITIINYGLGNIRSFVNLYERLNIKTKVANSTNDIRSATKIIERRIWMERIQYEAWGIYFY